MRRWLRQVPLFAAGVCAATGTVLSCVGLSQEPGVSLEPHPNRGIAERVATSIKITSDLVLIPVTVTDDNDSVITGLKKENFRLYDNKAETAITQFAVDDAPVSVGIVFDCSGSMGAKLQRAEAAVAEFMRTANPEDEFSLAAFSDRVRLLSDFTNHSEEIQTQLLFIRSGGATALLDAVYLMVQRLEHAKHSRKAILIISDGGDNASRYTTREVKKRLRESDVQIYAIGIFEPLGFRDRSAEEYLGPALLDEMASQTGGRLFEVNNADQLQDAAVKIGRALRNEYVLGFAPAGEHDGKYHRLHVKVPRIHGLSPLHASFRPGYYAR